MNSLNIKNMLSEFELNTGAKIPSVGFGTWQAAPGEVTSAVEEALRAGYRHVDCAAIYRNEPEVGQGIKNSGVSRNKIFLTSKLWNKDWDNVEAALDQSLKDLGTDYVDLYLIHWPVSFASGDRWFPLDDRGVFQVNDKDPSVAYKQMERLVQTGKVKAIGVSNFNIRRLEDLLKKTTVIPAVNQIEAHPYLQQPELKKFCEDRGILVEAYSPLGNNVTGEPRTVDDPVVHEVAKKVGIDPGALLASWAVQRGTVVLPKSVTPSRIRSNLEVKALDDEATKTLNGLERHKRFNFPARWGVDIFDEWGQEKVKQAALDAAEGNIAKFGSK